VLRRKGLRRGLFGGASAAWMPQPKPTGMYSRRPPEQTPPKSFAPQHPESAPTIYLKLRYLNHTLLKLHALLLQLELIQYPPGARQALGG